MVEFFSLDGESSTPVVHKVYRCFHCRGIDSLIKRPRFSKHYRLSLVKYHIIYMTQN